MEKNRDLHDQAMDLVDEAEEFKRIGKIIAARKKYEEAANLEEAYLDSIPEKRQKTRGIICVSAVSIWIRARNYNYAIELGKRYLSENLLPGFRDELRDLIGSAERELSVLEEIPVQSEEKAQALIAGLQQLETDIWEGRAPALRLREVA